MKIKKLEPTCYRFKNDEELLNEEGERVTKDIRCQVVPYVRNEGKGQRMIKFRFHNGLWYHIPARDVGAVLTGLDFNVVDVRGK